MTIPSFSMQAFLLPIGLCATMDKLCRRFLWGVGNDVKHYLSLRSWDHIYIPKSVGGLGLQKFKDINVDFITKLGWQVCSEPNRIWVQLIRSRYLHGRRTLDFQHTAKQSSWVWNGIRKCETSLQNGLCHTIRKHSTVNIREDQWIPDLPNFRPPTTLDIPPDLRFVSDLMNTDQAAWNQQLILSVFPPSLSKIILSIPIFDKEHDPFVWSPSATGTFSVRSSYRTNNKERFDTETTLDHRLWKLLWRSTLHERYKHLLWKVLFCALPTKDRLKHFISVTDMSCFLCHSYVETVDHLLFECPIAAISWIKSTWKIRISHYLPVG